MHSCRWNQCDALWDCRLFRLKEHAVTLFCHEVSKVNKCTCKPCLIKLGLNGRQKSTSEANLWDKVVFTMKNKGYFSAKWELFKLGQGWQEQDLGPQMASRVFLITHLKCIWLDCAHYMQYISIFYSILLAQWEIWAGMKSSCLLGKPRARLNLRIMLNSLHIGSGSKLW